MNKSTRKKRMQLAFLLMFCSLLSYLSVVGEPSSIRAGKSIVDHEKGSPSYEFWMSFYTFGAYFFAFFAVLIFSYEIYVFIKSKLDER